MTCTFERSKAALCRGGSQNSFLFGAFLSTFFAVRIFGTAIAIIFGINKSKLLCNEYCALDSSMSVASSRTMSNTHDTLPTRGGCRSKMTLTREHRVELLAAETLEQHPHFRGRGQLVEFRCVESCLTLSGSLPSFYLKQLAQEALRELGDIQIRNQISVHGVVGDVESTTENDSFPTSLRKPR